MKSLRRFLSLAIKERVLRHYLMPFSRHGVDPSLVRHFNPSGPVTLLDIGASSGEFTGAIEAHYGIRRALLVEPQPARCRALAERFPGPAFRVEQCALAEREATQEMEVLNWDYSSSLLAVRRDQASLKGGFDFGVRERIQCKVRPLDALLADVGWNEAVDLLKLDVQGAELMALRGAERTLPKVRMVLSEVSFRPLYEGSAVFDEVHRFLGERGFRMIALHEGFRGSDGELLQADALFLR